MYSACSKNGENVDSDSLNQCRQKALSRCTLERDEGLPDNLFYTKCKAFALVDDSVDEFEKEPKEATENLDDLLLDDENESDF